jgi:hypothetical protein
MKTIQEIAQWVIDNRYPKSENNKVSDAEMYHTLIEAMNQVLRQSPVVGRSEQLLSFFEHIQREYKIEADVTFSEALKSFKGK